MSFPNIPLHLGPGPVVAPILTGDYTITNADFKVPLGVSQTNLAQEPGAVVVMSTTESFTDPLFSIERTDKTIGSYSLYTIKYGGIPLVAEHREVFAKHGAEPATWLIEPQAGFKYSVVLVDSNTEEKPDLWTLIHQQDGSRVHIIRAAQDKVGNGQHWLFRRVGST